MLKRPVAFVLYAVESNSIGVKEMIRKTHKNLHKTTENDSKNFKNKKEKLTTALGGLSI